MNIFSNCPIFTKRKANISTKLKASNVTIGLTLVMALTLNFHGQIWNLLYISQNWSYCHETKIKHIDRTRGLQRDHQVWPWPWPWPRIPKVKYGIYYISAKIGSIANKRKENISIELQASNVTNGFDLDQITVFKVTIEAGELQYTCQFFGQVQRVNSKIAPFTYY